MNVIFETIVISLILLSFLVVVNVFIKKYYYKYDSKKQKNTLNSFNILIFITIIFIILEEYSHGNVALISKIFLIVLFMKIIYHSFGYYFIKKFGKKLNIEVEVKNKKLIDELFEQYYSKIIINFDDKSINQNNLQEYLKSTKLKLELNNLYYLRSDKIYKIIQKYVSNKTTSLIDIGLIILLSIFTLALILPIIKPLNDVFNNDYMLAVLAFLGAYVLNPAFPDMYAFFTFVRNKNIDLEKFISFYDNGVLVKGRIIEMTTSHIILKDHVQGISLTVPNMNLHNKVINNLDDLSEHLGFKKTLSYVIDYPSYKKDNGIKIKTVFQNILNEFEIQTKLISKQEQYNVWMISNNDGIEIKLWYYIKDIEKDEKIKLDIEDFILYKCSKIGFDLRTPKLIEIIK